MPSDHPWHPRPRSPRESLKDQAGRQSQNRLILPSLIKPTTNQNDDFFDSIGQYRTEAEAKGRCFSDTVVWVNLKSRIYHFAGTKNYGNTKEGTYMCERGAIAQGDRASKTEKHP